MTTVNQPASPAIKSKSWVVIALVGLFGCICIVVMGVVLGLGLRGQLSIPGLATSVPTQAPINIPANTPIPPSINTPVPPPTNAPIPTTSPTVTPPPSSQFFTEEFDNGQTNWSVNYIPADAIISTNPIGNVKVNFEKGYLQFNITDTYIGAFAVYDPFEYTDVRIDAHVANYGRVTNDFALVCRYSEKGFYEFNIKNDGYYFFNYIQIGGDGRMHIKEIYLGATTLVNRDTNDYGLLCQGSTFTMIVNGENIQEVRDSSLYSGKIGVEGFSLQVVPVDLHVEWVKISQP